jgi:hypothetical protein
VPEQGGVALAEPSGEVGAPGNFDLDRRVLSDEAELGQSAPDLDPVDGDAFAGHGRSGCVLQIPHDAPEF